MPGAALSHLVHEGDFEQSYKDGQILFPKIVLFGDALLTTAKKGRLQYQIAFVPHVYAEYSGPFR